MPRVEMKHLSDILKRKVLLDSALISFRENESEIIFGQMYLQDKKGLREDGSPSYLFLEKLLSRGFHECNKYSTKEKKSSVLSAIHSDIQLISSEHASEFDKFKKQIESETLMPILNHSVLYHQTKRSEKESFSLLKNYILDHPDNENAIKLKQMIFDESNSPRYIFSNSEFRPVEEKLSSHEMTQIIHDVFSSNKILKNKVNRVFSFDDIDTLKETAIKLINSTEQNGHVFSFMILDSENEHHTSMTLTKSNNTIHIYGSDSIAGDETFDRILSKVVRYIKEHADMSDKKIEYAYARNYLQKNEGLCGVYTLLFTLDRQINSPEKIFQKIKTLSTFDKNEKYLAEKIVRIITKLQPRDKSESIASKEKKHRLEEKLTEYCLYLSAMKYIRENPNDKQIQKMKLEKLLNAAPVNLETVFYREQLLSLRGSFQKLYSYTHNNYENLENVIVRNKEKIIQSIIGNSEKLEKVADIITGNNDIDKFTKFKTLSSKTSIHERFPDKHKKTLDMLPKSL